MRPERIRARVEWYPSLQLQGENSGIIGRKKIQTENTGIIKIEGVRSIYAGVSRDGGK
jgi:hypothetical protein